MKTLLRRRWPVALLLTGLALGMLTLTACSKGDGEATRYHCPMHPTYVADRPGVCPICGMRLVPIEAGEGEEAVHEHEAVEVADAAFICPMHPEVGSDDPGDRCAKCGMRLEPREQALEKIGTPDAHAGHQAPRAPGVAGMAPVEVKPEAARLAGFATAPATLETIGREIRTVGTIVPDETRVRHVHTKISGWVEKLHANFTGQEVRRGQPILAIYSPELLATQEEYLRALRTSERFAGSELPEVRRGGEDLLNAARRRLELFDVPASVIERLERTGEVSRTVTLVAPVSGYITSKQIFEGQQVEPGMELFTVTDLSTVWVEADFYEYEAAALQLGRQARVSLPYAADVELTGRITYVTPTLDSETRTVRARFEFPNPKMLLKPGMFADVTMAAETKRALVVPDSAVMDTGARSVVFVATRANRFEPREVKVGQRGGGKAEILSGLTEGERVVVKANFLLDSESRMKAAISGSGSTSSSAPPAGEHQH